MSSRAGAITGGHCAIESVHGVMPFGYYALQLILRYNVFILLNKEYMDGESG